MSTPNVLKRIEGNKILSKANGKSGISINGPVTGNVQKPKKEPKKKAVVRELKSLGSKSMQKRMGYANIIERDGMKYLAISYDGYLIQIPNDQKTLLWFQARLQDFCLNAGDVKPPREVEYPITVSELE